MKVIDLLNKIANGEEVPKKIKYNGYDWFWCGACNIYETDTDKRLNLYEYFSTDGNLYDEVEIIDDKPKVTVEMTEEEYFRYLDTKNIGSQSVEDEFIDIEEIPFNNEMNSLLTIYEEMEKMNYVMNDLIKNQKKIIERVDK